MTTTIITKTNERANDPAFCLVRGKCLEDAGGSQYRKGDWIYGTFCIQTAYSVPSIMYFDQGLDPWYNVIRMAYAIGRCVGTVDCDGEKIFEDDIVQEHQYHCVVRYEGGSFMLYNDEIAHGFPLNKSPLWSRCKVVGNIYDNPELLYQTPAERFFV